MRAFVGVDVGEAMREEAARVIAAISDAITTTRTPPRVIWVSPRDLHVTLRFLGEISADVCAALRQRFEAPIPMEPFEVAWCGIGAFPSPRRPRALWIGLSDGATELGRLESHVARTLDGHEHEEAGPFRPHVTLGRIKADGAGVAWPAILEHASVRGTRSAIDHVTLFQSHVTPRGSHYTELTRAWLRGPSAGEPSPAGGRA